MLIKWAIKDVISGKYIMDNKTWGPSITSLSGNIDDAFLWNKQGPAKAFITSDNKYKVVADGRFPYDLVPVPIEVSRKLRA